MRFTSTAIVLVPSVPMSIRRLRGPVDDAFWYGLAGAAGIEAPAVTRLGAVSMWTCGDARENLNLRAGGFARRLGYRGQVHGAAVIAGRDGSAGLTDDQTAYVIAALSDVAFDICDSAAALPRSDD